MRGEHRLLGLALLVGASLMAACGSTPPQPSPTTSGAPPTVSPTASPAPGPSSTTAPSTPPPDDSSVMPTPSTTDIALLITDATALTAREQQWLIDLRADYGRVDAVAYRAATAAALSQYFVVFVIDQSPELDVEQLAEAFSAGLTIHLVGSAAAYQARVAGGTQ